MGEAERTLHYARQAREISERIKFLYWSAWSEILIGWAKAVAGGGAGGVVRLKSGLDAYLATGSTQIVLFAHVLLAEAYATVGETEEARSLVADARAALAKSPIQYHRALLERLERRLQDAR